MSAKPAAPTKRPSTITVPAIKPQCSIDSTVIVADKAQLAGPHSISLGPSSIIHPHARLNAEHGNITLGRNCTVAEKSIVGIVSKGSTSIDVTLADGVTIESGAIVAASKIGEYTTIEVNAKVGEGAVVGKWCHVGALCEVRPQEVIEDYMVIFGDGQRRVDTIVRDRQDVKLAKKLTKEKEIELLKTLIPDGSAKWRG